MSAVVRTLALALLLVLASCYPHCAPMCPQISYDVKERDLRQLPAAFAPLSPSEQREPWAIELRVGQAFANELDFYRAITAYQRALILLPPNSAREQQIHYSIVLAYYLAGRRCDALEAFERSPLVFVDATFPALKDLLLILYDCYQVECQPERAATVLYQLEQLDGEEAAAMRLSTSIRTFDWCGLEQTSATQLSCLMTDYCECKKSERRAELLAAALPGAGYWYVGQRQAAITSALLNGLFIWASYAFFRNGYIAAGIITTSLELGWYFGGIYGSASAARTYNQRLWESQSTPYMRHYRLFVPLRLSFRF